MARPQRNNVDYFPFICDEGNKMFFIEEQYGNDGFATWVKILRELAKTDYHYLDLSKKTTTMFLSAKCKVSIETLESIIKDLVDLEKFDFELWNENKIIWCQDFIDSIQDAYAKRANKCINKNSLLLLLQSKGLRKPSKSTRKPSLLQSEVPVNPQSILKESIEDDENEISSTSIPCIENENLPKLTTFKEAFADYWNNQIALEAIALKNYSTVDAVQNSLLIFKEELKASGLKPDDNKLDFGKHFNNWINTPHGKQTLKIKHSAKSAMEIIAERERNATQTA